MSGRFGLKLRKNILGQIEQEIKQQQVSLVFARDWVVPEKIYLKGNKVNAESCICLHHDKDISIVWKPFVIYINMTSPWSITVWFMDILGWNYFLSVFWLKKAVPHNLGETVHLISPSGIARWDQENADCSGDIFYLSMPPHSTSSLSQILFLFWKEKALIKCNLSKSKTFKLKLPVHWLSLMFLIYALSRSQPGRATHSSLVVWVINIYPAAEMCRWLRSGQSEHHIPLFIVIKESSNCSQTEVIKVNPRTLSGTTIKSLPFHAKAWKDLSTTLKEVVVRNHFDKLFLLSWDETWKEGSALVEKERDRDIKGFWCNEWSKPISTLKNKLFKLILFS